MSFRLQKKDEQLQVSEDRVKERRENEIQFSRKKAEITFSTQVLKGELENLKVLLKNFKYTSQRK